MMNVSLKNVVKIGLTLVPVVLYSIGCSPVLQDDEPDAQDNTQQLTDTDKDGTPDVNDNDIDGDGADNWNDSDIDGDGKTNTTDTDIDGDGIINVDDNDIDGDGIDNTLDTDLDNDGKTNTSDSDVDGDGTDNIDDNDIDGDGVKNDADTDIDGDGVVNNNDSDIDNDGITNNNDNDIDGDGIENKTDSDIDNDGTSNTSDTTPGGTTDAGNGTNGTQGTVNQGTDQNNGTVNTGTDTNNGTTDNDVIDQSEGLMITAQEDVEFSVNLKPVTTGGSVEQTELVDLNEIRTTISDNDISLQSFQIVDMSLKASDASQPAISALGNIPFVLKLYYQVPNNPSTRMLAMQTPDQSSKVYQPLTTNMLASGLHLNKQLFGVQPGFDSYVALIRDESVDNIEVVTEIQFLQAHTQSGTIDLNFSIETEGKKTN
jgi:hypothetical protein